MIYHSRADATEEVSSILSAPQALTASLAACSFLLELTLSRRQATILITSWIL